MNVAFWAKHVCTPFGKRTNNFISSKVLMKIPCSFINRFHVRQDLFLGAFNANKTVSRAILRRRHEITEGQKTAGRVSAMSA
jgi:hypothetical protein